MFAPLPVSAAPPRPRPGFLRALRLLAALLCVVPPLAAKTSAWTDTKGASFRAEPIEVLGPFALFLSGATGGRRVLLRMLAPEDCVRFHRETAGRPPAAADWSKARGYVSGDLPGHVLRVENKQLVPATLAGRPEPEIFVLLFGSHNDGESWAMVRGFTPTYERIQRVYPGRLETVFFGVRDNAAEHQEIATQSFMPWLVSDFASQRSLNGFVTFAPAGGILMLAVSRDGAPLLVSRAEDVEAIKQFIDGLCDLLRLTDPANPAIGHDREHYFSAVRPGQFAHDQAGPLLVSNPLQPGGLRQHGVAEVRARLTIAADGQVAAAAVAPEGGVAEGMRAPLGEALRRGLLFSPAIDHGRPVAAEYDFDYAVPAESTAPAADLAWLHGEGRMEVVPSSWLVLRSIPVPESAFSSVDHIEANGTAVFTKITVGQDKVSHHSQMTAFNSDFFQETGAGAVHPAAGDAQVVDGQKYTWERVKARDGYVDLLEGGSHDYCVGYAWTELEAPQALDGWLGIGSDDGIKIWLNGELVHDRWVRRISRIDDDIVPLHLRAGRNGLLIKIQNATIDWSFICRLRLKPATDSP
jgi:hypothetical protein